METSLKHPHGNTIPLIMVIDPALHIPATICFNQMVVDHPDYRFCIHYPALFDLPSLKLDENICGIIILGSAAYVTEPQSWMKQIVDFALHSLERGTPVLGICFGHQLMGQAFGAVVDYVTPERANLSGIRTVFFESEFLDCAPGSTATLVVTHRQELKTLPPCLEARACSQKVAIEAVRHRTLPYIGVQAHPEASPFFMTEYVAGLAETEIELAREGGKKIVSGFLNSINKRSAR
jgi:GMP synthase (glutamine-hydrolysing)